MGREITAALSRQHPRDLFDCKHMKGDTLEEIKEGLFLCLLGSDKPIIESLSPNNVTQKEALENQFKGMSDIPFSYTDYEDARESIIKKVNDSLTNTDKEFFISFEDGTPQWEKCCAGDLSQYSSVQWKLMNIDKLKEKNPDKHKEGMDKLKAYFQV